MKTLKTMRKIATGLLVAAALTVTARAADNPPGHYEPWIGKEAPGFVLKDVGGKSVSLADYKGKLVVIHFGASW